MVKKLIAKPKKIIKIKNNSEKNVKIEKKQYSEEERLAKLREDRIKIAHRYEEMKLFDEAINYYKKLGLTNDVERVANTKRNIYIKKASEFERLGKLEDALRLYENLNMIDEVNRIRLDLGETKLVPESKPETVDTPTSAKTAEPEQKSTTPKPNYREPSTQLSEPINQKEAETEQIQKDQYKEIYEEKKSTPSDDIKKIFRICPYCGEELNLPKKPNFCPYCKEPFV